VPAHRAPSHCRRHLHRRRHGPQCLVVAEHPDARQHGMADLQLTDFDADIRENAGHGPATLVGLVNGFGLFGQNPAHPGVDRVEPEAHATVSGREGYQDARTEHEVRSDIALADEAVDVQTFVNLELEWRISGLHSRGGCDCKKPRGCTDRGRCHHGFVDHAPPQWRLPGCAAAGPATIQRRSL